MDVSYLQHGCISSPIRYRSLTKIPQNSKKLTLLRSIRRQNNCSASSSGLRDTIATGNSHSLAIDSKKGEEPVDLKSWMHSKGLPPCKVELRDKPSHDNKHRPIHYVVASEDLEVGDVAFTVPNHLVVTLERVLGNETIGIFFIPHQLLYSSSRFLYWLIVCFGSGAVNDQ